jgi:hypothetical protein
MLKKLAIYYEKKNISRIRILKYTFMYSFQVLPKRKKKNLKKLKITVIKRV